MPYSVIPARVDLTSTEIGPLYDENTIKEKTREKYCHRLNETISCVDRVNEVNTIKTWTIEETTEVKNERAFIATYEEMIIDHVERRIAVLFQQLVISYKTFLHFEIGKTLHQAESAKSIRLTDDEGKNSVLCKRNAAHSSTLPCIVAYDARSWKKYVENGEAKPNGFVYVHGGDIYRTANSTLDMPRAVNEADIEIDGERGRGLARDYAVGLLNQSAKGIIAPDKGIQDFLDYVIATTKERLQKTQRSDGVKKALEIFEAAFSSIKTRIEEEPKTFNLLLGVHVSDNHTDTPVQEKIYQLRYKAIRDNQYAQSAMIEKINAVRNSVLKNVGPKRKPVYFDEAFRKILCEEIRLNEDKKRMYKLFNIPHEHQLRETPNRQARFEATKEKIQQKQLQPIQTLAQELGNDLRNLKREEILRRGLVARELRSSLGWTQRELADKIKTIYSETAASQPTISRIENNIKIVDSLYAKQLADVFGVDVALLMPSFFYD